MQSQKRWGIVVLAVGMFFATTVAMQIFGNLLSMFGAAWIMIGWYAYKGDLQSASSWSKWAIFVGIGLVVLSYLFIGDNNNPVTMRVKNQSAVGVGVMAVPLILLYFYLVSQVTKIVNNTETGGEKNINPKNNHNPTPNNNTASAAPLSSKPSSFTASAQASTSHPLNDEIYYEQAMEEFDSNKRKGLWIKLLTHNEGDEVKSKFQYIKARAQEIQAEDAVIKVEDQKNSNSVSAESPLPFSKDLFSSAADQNSSSIIYPESSLKQSESKLENYTFKESDSPYLSRQTSSFDSANDKFAINFSFDYQHRSVLYVAAQTYVLTNDKNAYDACISTCTIMSRDELYDFVEYLLGITIKNAADTTDKRRRSFIEQVDGFMHGNPCVLTANHNNAWMHAIESKNIDAANKLFSAAIIKSA